MWLELHACSRHCVLERGSGRLNLLTSWNTVVDIRPSIGIHDRLQCDQARYPRQRHRRARTAGSRSGELFRVIGPRERPNDNRPGAWAWRGWMPRILKKRFVY